LRYHKCDLPVEIWHFPGEINHTEVANLTVMYNIAFRDITEHSLQVRVLEGKSYGEKNFYIKAAAIINSRFEEVE